MIELLKREGYDTDFRLRLKRMTEWDVHEDRMKRAMQEALDFCQTYQPDQVRVIECARDYSVQQRKKDSANPVWRDAEYFFLSYLAVLNGDIAHAVGAAGLLPFYNALKALAFGSGTQEQLRTVLAAVGLANDEPLSEPGGYPWAIRGLWAGVSTWIGDLFPGNEQKNPVLPFAPGQPVVPVLPAPPPASRNARAAADAADTALRTFFFPTGVKTFGLTKPIYVDSAFGKESWWVERGFPSKIKVLYELGDASTRFKSLMIPVGTLPKGTSATLKLNDKDYQLQEGKKFDFRGGGATSFWMDWPAIPAKGGKPARYVLGLTFTKATALASIEQRTAPPRP